MEKTAQKQHIPSEVAKVSDALQKAGFEAYLVGGCVRDLLRGEKPKDWDIATNARPEKVQELFEHTYYENTFGTVGVVNDKTKDSSLKNVEVTTYRLESTYSDARHPDSVTFSDNLDDDLKRRDFTINAMALTLPVGIKDISKGHLVDLFAGKKDLVSGQIRAVGKPESRFKEDALRMLRAVRFASELGFTVSRETGGAIERMAQQIDKIALERVRDEFVRIVMSPNPKKGLELAHDLGLLRRFLPELTWGIDVEQNQAHSYSVFEHSVRTLQAAADKNFPLHVRLAALFHDISKPKTRAWDEKKNDWSFHNHQVVGARVAKTALQRLRFSGETTKIVAKLVRHHMFFSDTDVITHSAVRRLLQAVGTDLIWDLINLRICDRVGTGRPKEEPYRLRKFQAMIEEVQRDPISVGMLAIDGKTLMDVSHETPGPRIGWALHALLDEVMEDPGKNTSEYLEKRSLELFKLSDKKLAAKGRAGMSTKDKKEEEEVQKIRGEYYVQ